jgi:hypothetical protein
MLTGNGDVLVISRSLFLVMVHLLELYGKQYDVTEEDLQQILEFLAAEDESIMISIAEDKVLDTMGILNDIFNDVTEIENKLRKGDVKRATLDLVNLKFNIKQVMVSEGFLPQPDHDSKE